MHIVPVLLFGSWILSETPITPEPTEVRAEYRAITGYSFEDVPTQKDWITKEIQTKWVLRVRKSYPKDAKTPITEVVGFRLHSEKGLQEGVWLIEKSLRSGYGYVTNIEQKNIYFNL